MIKFYTLFALIALAAAAPSIESDGLLSKSIKFVKDCGDKSITLCLKVSEEKSANKVKLNGKNKKRKEIIWKIEIE